MNQKQRMMEEAVCAAREAYQKAANNYLAAVEATPDEIDAAFKIIADDCDTSVLLGIQPQDALNYEENLASTILNEVREVEE